MFLAAYCAALASRVTDKCQATPLAESDYATKTAKLLRDAFQPLQSVLASLDLQEIEICKGLLYVILKFRDTREAELVCWIYLVTGTASG